MHPLYQKRYINVLDELANNSGITFSQKLIINTDTYHKKMKIAFFMYKSPVFFDKNNKFKILL